MKAKEFVPWVVFIVFIGGWYLAVREPRAPQRPVRYLTIKSNDWSKVAVTTKQPRFNSDSLIVAVTPTIEIESISRRNTAAKATVGLVEVPVSMTISVGCDLDLHNAETIDIDRRHFPNICTPRTPEFETNLYTVLYCEVLFNGWDTRPLIATFDPLHLDKKLMAEEMYAALVAASKSLAARGLKVTRLAIQLDFTVQGQQPVHLEQTWRSDDATKGGKRCCGRASIEARPHFYPKSALFHFALLNKKFY